MINYKYCDTTVNCHTRLDTNINKNKKGHNHVTLWIVSQFYVLHDDKKILPPTSEVDSLQGWLWRWGEKQTWQTTSNKWFDFTLNEFWVSWLFFFSFVLFFLLYYMNTRNIVAEFDTCCCGVQHRPQPQWIALEAACHQSLLRTSFNMRVSENQPWLFFPHQWWLIGWFKYPHVKIDKPGHAAERGGDRPGVRPFGITCDQDHDDIELGRLN